MLTESISDRGAVSITGAGPGLGASLCRAITQAGVAVAGLARSTSFGAEPTTYLDPGAIALPCLNLVDQDRSVWTHEPDLQPYAEKF